MRGCSLSDAVCVAYWRVAQVAPAGDAVYRVSKRTALASVRCFHLHCAHGRDVETEEATANNGDGRDEVDVAELLHVGRG